MPRAAIPIPSNAVVALSRASAAADAEPAVASTVVFQVVHNAVRVLATATLDPPAHDDVMRLGWLYRAGEGDDRALVALFPSAVTGTGCLWAVAPQRAVVIVDHA